MRLKEAGGDSRAGVDAEQHGGGDKEQGRDQSGWSSRVKTQQESHVLEEDEGHV